MKKKYAIMALAAFLLVLGASVGPAFSYFTTYATARGGQTLTLGEETRITEEFDDWQKTVAIENSETSTPVFVRVKAFGPSQYPLQYQGSEKWSPGADGYYYYSDILQAGETTDRLVVSINNVPRDGVPTEDASFDVAVVYETAPVLYNDNGEPYADWSLATVETEGGE
ncbi:MAG: hypothetical protein ACOX8R_02755 [Bacillota bacterium]|jgi:hypothetical protein